MLNVIPYLTWEQDSNCTHSFRNLHRSTSVRWVPLPCAKSRHWEVLVPGQGPTPAWYWYGVWKEDNIQGTTILLFFNKYLALLF